MPESLVPIVIAASLLLLGALAWRLLEYSRYLRFVRRVRAARLEEAQAMVPALLRTVPRLLEGGPMLAQAALDVRLLGLPLPTEPVLAFFEDVARLGRAQRPASAAFLRLQANLLRQRGRLDEGRPLMEEAVRRAPDDPVNHQQFGWFLELSGRLEAAADEYRRALELVEDGAPRKASRALVRRLPALRASLLRSLSQCLSRQGRLDAAVETLAQAVAADPCSTEGAFTRLALAGLHERRGAVDEAVASLREALELCGDEQSLVRQALAGLLTRSGRYDEAAAELERIGYEGEMPVSLRLARAELEAGRGRIGEARAELESAVEADPRNSLVQLALAQHFERQGDDARAMVHLERAVEAGPPDPGLADATRSARERLADCYARLGRLDDAEREYRRALKEGARNPSLKASLGQLLVQAGREEEGASLFREAREHLEAELLRAPGDPRLHQAVGSLLLHSEGAEPARPHLLRAAELGTMDFFGWRDLGEAEAGTGHPEEARRAWTRALDLAARPDLRRQVEDQLEATGQISTDTPSE